jgi:DNA invertase Pin-like site-specific DNA recombinase
MLIGYARVSTLEQRLELQQDVLRAAGCEQVFSDTASGAKTARPGLAAALEAGRAGDVLVVWKLDRLGRSLAHLVETVQALAARGIGLRCLQEQLDTTTSGGRLIFHIFASLAEFERDLIQERTHAGLTAARARGRKGGRPKGVDEKSGKRRWRSSAIRTTASKRFVRLSGSRAIPTTSTPASEILRCCVLYPRLFSALYQARRRPGAHAA